MLNKLNKPHSKQTLFIQQLLRAVKPFCRFKADFFFFALLELFELLLPTGSQGQWRCSERSMRKGKSDGGRRAERGQSELSTLNENCRQINALCGEKKKAVQGMNLGCWIGREPVGMCAGPNFHIMCTLWCVCPVGGWEAV